MKAINLEIPKVAQKFDDECGPACVAQVLKFFSIEPEIDEIIEACSNSYKTRDWDYKMGTYLLSKSLKVTINTFQSFIYDPSWFNLDKNKLLGKLQKELNFLYSNSPRLKDPTYTSWHNANVEISEIEAAIEFLEKGGVVTFLPISKELIQSYLNQMMPVICAFDAILLHGMKRGFRGKPDDVSGVPQGHMAVISGYTEREFILVDPSCWYRAEESYKVDADRLINSILVRDQNLIICSSSF